MINGINPFFMVAGVTFVIWAGIFFFLLRVERMVKEINR